jgi:hypothetical protein
MMEEFGKLLKKSKEEFYPNLFGSKHAFSIVTPQSYKTIADAIYNANQNISWYKDNKHLEIAAKISEYGIAFCQYSYSLPRPVTEFFLLFMMFNYPDYFEALGYKLSYYNKEKGEFNVEAITQAIEAIEQKWTLKYPGLKMNTEKLIFTDKTALNLSFATEVENLSLDTR